MGKAPDWLPAPTRELTADDLTLIENEANGQVLFCYISPRLEEFKNRALCTEVAAVNDTVLKEWGVERRAAIDAHRAVALNQFNEKIQKARKNRAQKKRWLR